MINLPFQRRKRRKILGIPVTTNRDRKRKISRLLGEGYQAKVYRKNSGTVRKVYKLYPFSSRRKKVAREAEALLRARRTGVAPKLKGTGRNYLEMQLIPGQTMKAKIAGKNSRRQKTYAKRLAKAVKKVHSAQVVHNDLHSKNIIVTPRGRIKVIDYGAAKVRNRPLTGRERRKDVNRILKSHSGRDLQPFRESFAKAYGVG